MSKESVELVTRVLREARDRPAALWEVLDDDVVWEVGALGMPDIAGTYRGPDGVREFFRRWVGPFDEWDFEAVEVRDEGDSVLCRIRQWGRGRGSGAEVENEFWLEWTVRDGRIVRCEHSPLGLRQP
jgi:ketosteroid isomerase-like protein